MVLLQGGQLLLLVPSVFITLALTLCLSPWSSVIAGRRCYLPLESVTQNARARARRVRPSGGRRRGAAAAAAQEQDVDLGGAESLLMLSLGHRDAHVGESASMGDTLVFASVFVMVTFGIMQAAERWLGFAPAATLPLMAVCLVGLGIHVLVQADLRPGATSFSASGSTSGQDKVYAAFFGIVGFAVAMALHAAQSGSPSLFCWDMPRAAGAVQPLLVAWMRSSSRGLGLEAAIPELNVPPSFLQVGLSIAAGALGMVLFVPSMRFIRGFWLQCNVPDWAGEHITAAPLATLLLHLQLLVPMAGALLWVLPISVELFGLQPRTLLLAQAGALLASAAVAAVNTRVLVQRFLDGALTGWYTLKHGGVASSAADRATLGALIKLKCQLVHSLVTKAAVQCLGPAAVFLGLGVLLLYSALHPALAGLPEVNVLLESCVGFLGFWACSCWFVFSATNLWMFRTGMLVA